MKTERIDLFYDLYDSACMLLYDELKINYLDIVVRVSRDLTEEINPQGLTDETIVKLEEIYKAINSENFYNEEVRLALELLCIKALKHVKMSCDIMTPDTIGYLISHIIQEKSSNNKISILDTALGTGNLLQLIANSINSNCELIGIENDQRLIDFACASSNLQNNNINIYFQDGLMEVHDVVDYVIGDLDSYYYQNEVKNSYLYSVGVTFYPYLLMEKRLDNVKDNGYFIYVIDNDFFSLGESQRFRNFVIDKMTFMALIVLPNTMFNKDHVGKSILICKKAVLKNYQMAILNIKSFEKDYLEKMFIELEKMIREI